MKVMCQTDTQHSFRRDALCAVMHLARDSDDLVEIASQIVHPLMRLLTAQNGANGSTVNNNGTNSSNGNSSSNKLTLQAAALTSLSYLLCRLGLAFVPFIIPIRRKLQLVLSGKNGPSLSALPQLELYEALVSGLLKQRPLPHEPGEHPPCVRHYLLALPLCATSLHYLVALPHALPLCTTSLHYHFALPRCNTSLHYLVALPRCTTSLHYLVALPRCTTSLHYLVALPRCRSMRP